jgi:hypothetical protein
MMADNYKILAQDTAESIEENSGENQANTLYAVPSNTQASISSVSLINAAETNVEYSLGVVKAEDVSSSVSENNVLLLSVAQTIVPTRSIEPNVVDEIVGGITLSEGDQIRIYSESPDLIAQVYGVEIA